MENVVVNNPAIEYFLAKFIDETSNAYECNMCVENISMFLAGEASRFLSTEEINVRTPLGNKLCQINYK